MAAIADGNMRLTWFLMVFAAWSSTISTQSSQITLEYMIYEETPAETFVAAVADDAGLAEQDGLSYSIITQNSEYSSSFTMHATTGVLRTAHEIDRDTICPQEVECIIAIDIAVQPREFFQIIKLMITIEDTNDNPPVFLQDYMSKSVTENSPIGSTFSIFNADDIDSPKYGISSYRMTAGEPEFTLQVSNNIDGSTELSVMLMVELDREEREFYQIVVIAVDSGPSPNTGVLTIDITVTDVNDNSPQFVENIYEVETLEDVAPGTVIAQVRATDLDSGTNGQIVYGFDTATEHQFSELFMMNNATGQISLRTSLDYEQETAYNLAVTARDKNPDSLTAVARVVIHVLDVNDHAPEISINALTDTGHVEISEKEPVGTFVALIRVSDPDEGSNGEFSCALEGSTFETQQLYDNEFQIITSAALDREVTAVYNVAFVCQDNGSPALSSTEHITINILDENDNTPAFSKQSYSVVIDENNRLGAFLIQVTAVDEDSGANGAIEYRVNDPGSAFISIDPASGNVTARVEFDFEEASLREFSITAFDHGNPQLLATATILVTITDTDDALPVFDQDPYEFSVDESQPIGTEIGQVQATDADSPPFNEFRFYLDSDKGFDDVFYMEPNTGRLFTRQSLDREALPVYDLFILAIAKNTPDMTSSCQLIISVNDLNDNEPLIFFPKPENNTVYVENVYSLEAVITQVIAGDMDAGGNGQLTYIILSGNEEEYFTIEPDTGIISADKSLRSLYTQIFQLTIQVSDHGFPPHQAITTLNIVVNKSEEYTPVPSHNVHIVISVVSVTGLLTIILIGAIIIVKRQGPSSAPRKVAYTNQVMFPKTVITNSDGTNDKDDMLHDVYQRDVEADKGDIYAVVNKQKSESTIPAIKDNQMLYAMPHRVPTRTPSLECHSLACDSAPVSGAQASSEAGVPRAPSTTPSGHTNHHLHYLERTAPAQKPGQSTHDGDADSNHSMSLSNSDSGRGSNEDMESSESNALNQTRDEVVLRPPRTSSHSRSGMPNLVHNPNKRRDPQSVQNPRPLPPRGEQPYAQSVPKLRTPSVNSVSTNSDHIPLPPSYEQSKYIPASPPLRLNNPHMDQLKQVLSSRSSSPQVPTIPPRDFSPGGAAGHAPSGSHCDLRYGSRDLNPRINQSFVEEEESEADWSDEDREYVYYVNASQV